MRFFQRFIEDYSLIDQDTLTLSVNFRSGQEIVAHTQDFISNFFRSTGAPSPRLKASELRSASMATVSSYKRIDVETDGFDIALEHISIELEKGCASQSNAMAILCRTNAEVARAYKSLHPSCPELVIQNKARYSISQMRHLGIWVDLMKVMAQDGNLPLSESIYEKVQNEYVKTNIPEVERPSPDDITPRQLWELCTREHSYPYLSHLIEFVESFDSDQVNRLLGKERKPLKPPVVSTIHKVKGLEFDEVFVMPSLTDFPMEIGKALRSAAAEEARLYYVAMTRAKSGLTYFFGPRERGWSGAQTFPGNRGSVKILEGKHDEVAPSWAWETNGKTSRGKSNPDANLKLSYIREWVRVGDKITVDHDGYSLMHTDIEGRTFIIGQLAEKKGPGRYNSDLTVSAVVRYPYNGKQYFKGETDISVEKNEWGLAVLVSGFL